MFSPHNMNLFSLHRDAISFIYDNFNSLGGAQTQDISSKVGMSSHLLNALPEKYHKQGPVLVYSLKLSVSLLSADLSRVAQTYLLDVFWNLAFHFDWLILKFSSSFFSSPFISLLTWRYHSSCEQSFNQGQWRENKGPIGVPVGGDGLSRGVLSSPEGTR